MYQLTFKIPYKFYFNHITTSAEYYSSIFDAVVFWPKIEFYPDWINSFLLHCLHIKFILLLRWCFVRAPLCLSVREPVQRRHRNASCAVSTNIFVRVCMWMYVFIALKYPAVYMIASGQCKIYQKMSLKRFLCNQVHRILESIVSYFLLYATVFHSRVNFIFGVYLTPSFFLSFFLLFGSCV